MTIRLDRNHFRELRCHLHDHAFDLAGARHDSEEGTWQIPFSSKRAGVDVDFPGCLLIPFAVLWRTFSAAKTPVPECPMDQVLTITSVKSWRVDDRARIGIYTLNRVVYEEQHSRLLLIFCEDCEVLLEVGPDSQIVADVPQE
jgi:hypothetical protein